MLAGVIFDFDGVIVDSHPLHLQAWKTFFRSVGREVRDDELSFVLEGAKREEILRHFLGDLTQAQVRAWGAEKARLFQAHAGELKMVRGFGKFLAQVEEAGLPMAVATSGSRSRVECTLKTFGLLGRFRAIVTAEDVARGKPDPHIFHLAASLLQLDCNEVLVCEDAVNGVYAAKAARMRCLALATQGRADLLHKAGADQVVADFSAVSFDQLQKLFSRD
jgi:HAD superfamily hydrolase (TIGR01509 family)